jgi:hypothetical protein
MSLVVELHFRVMRTDGRPVTSRQLFSLVRFDDAVKDLFDDVEDWFEPRGYSGLYLHKWIGGGFRRAPLRERQFRERVRRDLRQVARWLRRQPAPTFRSAAEAGLQAELFVGVYSTGEGEWPLRLGRELLSACEALGLCVITEEKISWTA